MDASGGSRPEASADSIGAAVLLAAIIALSDDAIFTCDGTGGVISWSASSERIFGRSEGEVRGGPLHLLFPGHLSRDVQGVMANVLKGDRVRHFETEVLRPDGMPLPVSLSLSTLLDVQGVPVGAVVIARDVTEQHLAQATLAEVDARMEEGEALAHIGSWLWDTRTGVVQWSTEFHRIHGMDPLDFDGTFESHLGLIHSDDREIVRAAMVQSVESGRPFNAEYRVVRPDRQVRRVQMRAQPTFGSTGKAVGLRGIGQDTTTLPGSPAEGEAIIG
ncbi:MAG: PAS domain-containing protein [Acidimicrobiales bacterium]